MKKRVGISFSKTSFEHYWNWFSGLAGYPDIEPVELSFVKNNMDALAGCEGFVLTGGVDIDPCFYHSSDRYDNRPEIFQTDRDRFEEKIFRHAQAHQLPVLGICRGLQLVNVLLGGRLIQDLGTGGNTIHRKIESDKSHEVQIERNSMLYDIVQVESGKVNSAHHQAIDRLGNGLKVNARSYDGVIEGIEWENPANQSFLLCVQWHPERMFRFGLQDSPLSRNIREKFISVIANKT